ncbi:MAG TPA: hypothetical protein VEL31_02400 [Ktedonobacteraceae bacterium]|nr:hypothetical protein [Ktedonobacteraceae bacterium]
MKISMAHLRDQGIDFAVFDAEAQSHMNHDRDNLLQHLTVTARSAGLKVDKAALAFRQGNRISFYGTPDLVRYLQTAGVPRWTHTIDA